MSYHTLEITSRSNKGWKRPLYTGGRVYRTMGDVMRRIRELAREFGEDNVVHEPKSGDPTTEVVYIRLY